jgi:hypothetical protein
MAEMAETNSNSGHLTAYKLLILGYGFLASLSIMLLEPVGAGVVFHSLQCLSLVFVIPVFFSSVPIEDTWPGRFGRRLLQLSYAGGLIASGAAAALLASFVTPVPATRILLLSLFAAAFCVFLAGVCSAARTAFGAAAAQLLTLLVGLLMCTTPYYVNPFIQATAGELRMYVVQAAVNVNPLLVGAAGILRYDWLRAPHLYERCLIGGHQYPFYYPSPIKAGIILFAAGMLLIAASSLRKVRNIEGHS